MQEFLLFSQIPHSRHDQVLQILAGVTASRATPTKQQTLIYSYPPKPTNTSKKAATNKQTQPSAPMHVKLVRDLQHGDKQPWTLRTEDVPQPGITNTISRTVSERLLSDTELETFRQGAASQIRYINQYITHPGHRFVQNNLIIRISRILLVPDSTGFLEPLDAPVPTLSDCKAVDPSGAYLFEVMIRVEDGGNTTLVEKAVGELLAFKKQMDGVVELKVPERLSLDTRVK
ncbi:hypothetical protein LTR62_000562 [Meristemomyces frigidus]|uniref:Mediator of RNA polymerase II transcription subunit 18 n=1 Tax=Meristemomyces frigidus TaxID=1508187 RepID=A0AAN7YLI8_9PEZI|nr:hypothetical protein LTR62_000562 [Meristemomyces frigidus]